MEWAGTHKWSLRPRGRLTKNQGQWSQLGPYRPETMRLLKIITFLGMAVGGIEAGIAIVIIAMIMDHITQNWAKKQEVVSQEG